MSNYRGLHEILTQRIWDIHPEALHAFKEIIDKNIAGHIPFVMEHDKLIKPFMLSSRDSFREQLYVGTARYIEWYEELRDEDQIINVISINGPITRNGGACSYGSKEVRDYLMQAADMEHVIGHIVVIDSPGGSSEAKYDFEQAISYVRRERKQPVIALIDGMACSAAYALAALCDEIYVINPKNKVGCIGTMAAFYYTPDGAQDTQTQRIYIERYAEGSPYKNKMVRDLSVGDDSELIAYLNRSADDFKRMLTEYRPQVTDEQKKGLTYEAQEVMGTLVDGTGTMQSCIERVLALSGNAIPQEEDPSMQQVGDEPKGEGYEDDEEDAHTVQQASEEGSNETLTPNDNQQEMSKSYEKIQSACGAGALESDKNGLYLQTIYCEKLEAHLTECEQKAETLDAKMQEIAGLNESIEQLKSNHAAAVVALKAEYETKLTEAADKLAQAEGEAAEARQQLEAQLQEANSKLADKEAELNEMAAAATASPKPEAPKSDAVADGHQKASPLVCSAGKSAEENRKALKERMEQLRRQRNG